MDDIFKKFSDSSRRVLFDSQKIAQSMNSSIGSEHLLLALALTPGTISAELLRENMVTPDQIRLILSLRGLKPALASGINPGAKQIIQNAVKLAAQYRHLAVESEHLLLAILNDPQSLAYQIINQITGSPQELTSQIKDLFQDLTGMDDYIQNDLNPKKPTSDDEIPVEEQQFGPQIQTQAPFFGGLFGAGQTSALGQFTIDLTAQAQNNQLDPVIGREDEIKRVIQILCRRLKNNPVLVGEPGVGKTAIVEGLAIKISRGEVPDFLLSKRILILDLALMVAGTMYRGQFEERLKKVIDEIAKTGNTIVFIDEIHTMVGTGSAEGSMDAANILKPALAKGRLHLIGATTSEEYRKYIEKDAALERRLQMVKVLEPTAFQAKKILLGLKEQYEKHHRVKISDEAVEAAVELSTRYLNDRLLPDKAIDLIDEAASAAQIQQDSGQIAGRKIREWQNQLKETISSKEQAVEAENFQKAAYLRAHELRLKNQLNQFKDKIRKNQKNVLSIDRQSIAKIVSQWTGIPLGNLLKDEKDRFLNLEKTLQKSIIGQNEAVRAITLAINRSKTGLGDPKRPIGSFIFLGPTGVGKTELGRVLAEEVFSGKDALVKIDMSEFSEKHNVSRLVGAPPGYVGYEEAGKLTETIRRQPYSVVLFDEIEKAHPEVFNLLLQVLEDGYLTDAKGKKVSFQNTIIIMTSNIGVHELSQYAALGFQARSQSQKENANMHYQRIKEKVLEKIKDHFRPEFLNRLDQVIVFKPLSEKDILKITNLETQKLIERLAQEKINLVFSKDARSFLAKAGFSPQYGARNLKRTITQLVENPLSDLLLEGKFNPQDKIKVSVTHKKINFSK